MVGVGVGFGRVKPGPISYVKWRKGKLARQFPVSAMVPFIGDGGSFGAGHEFLFRKVALSGVAELCSLPELC